MKKITFIIPAYNAETTIRRTVLSIEELHVDSEILIVENGSMDNTRQVSDNLSREFCNIRVLTSEKGVSKARNKGIEEATGQWIVFADADDECIKGIAELNDFLDNSSVDLIIGGYKKDNDSIIHEYGKRNVIIDVNDSVKAWMLVRPTLRMQAWAKVYRREFLCENKLLFDETLSYSEDSEYVIRVLNKARKMIITDKLFYQYHSGTTSAMRGVVQGRIDAYIDALNAAEQDIVEESTKVKRAFADYIIAHINIIGVHDIFAYDIKASWRSKCRKMSDLLSEDVLRRGIENTSVRENPQAFPVMLCKYHLTCIGGMIYYVRSLQNRRRNQMAREKE